MKNEIKNLATFTRNEVETMIRDTLRTEQCGYGQWNWRAEVGDTKLSHYSTDATVYDAWKNAANTDEGEQAKEEAVANLVETLVEDIKEGRYDEAGLYFCANSARAVNDCKFMAVPEKYFDIGTCIFDLIDAGDTCRIEDAFSSLEKEGEE